MADPLRVTIAAILMLMAIGIIVQTGTFLLSVTGVQGYAKWLFILAAFLTALVLSFWIYYVY